MIAGQTRKLGGKFGNRQPGTGHPAGNGEPLTATIKFKTTEQNARKLGILFYQHREEFGWQVPPDMYRELMMTSWNRYVEKTANPTPEMLATKRRHEELERMEKQALRHMDFEHEMELVDRCVEATMRAGDLEAVGTMLSDFVAVTKVTTDAAIRARRDMEYDRRWKRMHEGLRRHGTFNPADFEREEGS